MALVFHARWRDGLFPATSARRSPHDRRVDAELLRPHSRGAGIAAGLFVGSWVGAKMANDFAPAAVQRAFAVFMVVMAVRMWVTAR